MQTSGKPMFLAPKGNELWTLVLEKAWAKMFGNYCATETGTITEAYRALLGSNANAFSLINKPNVDKVWEQIMRWEKEKVYYGLHNKGDCEQRKIRFDSIPRIFTACSLSSRQPSSWLSLEIHGAILNGKEIFQTNQHFGRRKLKERLDSVILMTVSSS